jgi:hypothetical protein
LQGAADAIRAVLSELTGMATDVEDSADRAAA